MAKTKISEFSSTPGNNTDIDSINIAEGCAPSGINDAIRELMAQLKDFQTGAAGDSFNGPIGTTTAAAGAFTNLTASGTLGVTGVATFTAKPVLSSLTASQAVFSDGSKGLVSNAITGTGNVVMSTSPTLVTPVLGTPTSVTLTNATGLPISTGVSGLGTGIATALAVNVGSAGAPVLFNGALGTPSSGTVTNLTGTASININGTVGATTANTGAFTTLSASGAVTLSGATANGVAFLNASKQLTTGSALAFDGTNLKNLQSTASPVGLILDNVNAATSAGTRVAFQYGGASTGYVGNQFDGTDFNNQYQANRHHIWFTGASPSEQMRLTSTGLGIGTSSPSLKLDVAGSAKFAGSYVSFNDNGYIRTDAANILRFQPGSGGYQFRNAGNSDNLAVLDSSGNLGLGVAPSAWQSATIRPIEINRIGNFVGGNGSAAAVYLGANARFESANWRYANNGAAGLYTVEDNTHFWRTAPSGTAGNAISFTQAMTLDASGNLVVGDTSTTFKFDVNGGSRFRGEINAYGAGDRLIISPQSTGNGVVLLAVNNANSAYAPNTLDGSINVFKTAGTERARITSSGYFKASNNGTYGAVASSFHELNQSIAEQGVVVLYGNNASTTAAGMLFIETARNTTNNTYYAISYYNSGAAAYKFRVADSGNVTNTNNSYGAISDAKLKENVTDATPKLEKLQQVRVVNYNLIGEDQKQLGVIAQELEQIFPGMVDEAPDRDQEGNDLGTTTKSVKYSVFVPMLIKAMQEQQAIIESLKARLDAANL